MAIDVAIGPIFLLGIDFYLRGEAGPNRRLLHIIITSYGSQGGAALRHVGQTWASPFVYSFSSLYRAGGRRRALFVPRSGRRQAFYQHCLFATSRRSTWNFVPSRSSCL